MYGHGKVGTYYAYLWIGPKPHMSYDYGVYSAVLGKKARTGDRGLSTAATCIQVYLQFRDAQANGHVRSSNVAGLNLYNLILRTDTARVLRTATKQTSTGCKTGPERPAWSLSPILRNLSNQRSLSSRFFPESSNPRLPYRVTIPSSLSNFFRTSTQKGRYLGHTIGDGVRRKKLAGDQKITRDPTTKF
jgi:hypothetical protein